MPATVITPLAAVLVAPRVEVAAVLPAPAAWLVVLCAMEPALEAAPDVMVKVAGTKPDPASA